MSANLTLIGTPFSTFTRTIALGLIHKNIPFEQHATAPHSAKASSCHPFGYIPILIVEEINGVKVDLQLRESQAIVRYIDRLVPVPSLHLSEDDAILEEKMWEFVSIVAAYGYNKMEIGVIKPRVAAIDDGKGSDETIDVMLAEPIDEMIRFLSVVEGLMTPSGYVFGGKLSWADFFLYPLVADLEVIAESRVLTPRLRSWSAEMKKLVEVDKTFEGTLAAGGRPPED